MRMSQCHSEIYGAYGALILPQQASSKRQQLPTAEHPAGLCAARMPLCIISPPCHLIAPQPGCEGRVICALIFTNEETNSDE